MRISQDTEDRVKLLILDGREDTCRECCTSYMDESVKEGVRNRMLSEEDVWSFGVKRAVLNDDDER